MQIETEEDELWGPDWREEKEQIKARGLRFMQWLMTRPEHRIAVVSHSSFLFFTMANFGHHASTLVQVLASVSCVCLVGKVSDSPPRFGTDDVAHASDNTQYAFACCSPLHWQLKMFYHCCPARCFMQQLDLQTTKQLPAFMNITLSEMQMQTCLLLQVCNIKAGAK